MFFTFFFLASRESTEQLFLGKGIAMVPFPFFSLLFLLLLLRPPGSLVRGQGFDPETGAPIINGVVQYAQEPTIGPQELLVEDQCGLPGEGYDRVQASIDFTLCCKAMGHRCCAECKCQWALYYEMASACFDQFKVYKGEVNKRKEEWDRDARDHCRGALAGMGDKYASNPTNKIWRAQHAGDPPPNDNMQLANQREAGLAEKEWCGAGAAVVPSRTVGLLAVLTSCAAALIVSRGAGRWV